jgi:hypothetical protein
MPGERIPSHWNSVKYWALSLCFLLKCSETIYLERMRQSIKIFSILSTILWRFGLGFLWAQIVTISIYFIIYRRGRNLQWFRLWELWTWHWTSQESRWVWRLYRGRQGHYILLECLERNDASITQALYTIYMYTNSITFPWVWLWCSIQNSKRYKIFIKWCTS